MAIKYYVSEKKRQVIGVLSDCQYDAINKIDKMIRDTDFCFCPSEKYLMPKEYRAVVQCDPRDEFSIEKGMKIAKERILKRYYPALDKRVSKFFDALLALNGKIFKTPNELKENT